MPAPFQPDDIRGERAVAEPRRQHHPHGDAARPAFDQPHQRRLPRVERHRVGQRHLALVGGEACLQHQRVVQVPPLRRRRGAIRRDPPCPILGAAKQCGEAGRAVEARPAEPLDRAAAPDQRCRAAVADQAVLLDWRWSGAQEVRRAGRHRAGSADLPEARVAARDACAAGGGATGVGSSAIGATQVRREVLRVLFMTAPPNLNNLERRQVLDVHSMVYRRRTRHPGVASFRAATAPRRPSNRRMPAPEGRSRP